MRMAGELQRHPRRHPEGNVGLMREQDHRRVVRDLGQSAVEIVHAFEGLQAYLGRPIRAVTPIEAGGLNSTTPFIVVRAVCRETAAQDQGRRPGRLSAPRAPPTPPPRLWGAVRATTTRTTAPRASPRRS